MFKFWTIPEMVFSWPFQIFYVLDRSEFFEFCTIAELLCLKQFQTFLCSVSTKKFLFLDHSCIFKFWTIPEFFAFLTIQTKFQTSDGVRKVSDSVRRSWLISWVKDFLKIYNAHMVRDFNRTPQWGTRGILVEMVICLFSMVKCEKPGYSIIAQCFSIEVSCYVCNYAYSILMKKKKIWLLF